MVSLPVRPTQNHLLSVVSLRVVDGLRTAVEAEVATGSRIGFKIRSQMRQLSGGLGQWLAQLTLRALAGA